MQECMRLVIGKELIKLAAEYDFTVFNTDSKCCGLEEFGKLYPDREFRFGIAEQNMLASASGYAGCGQKVIVPMFAVFASMRACEQVRSFICYPKHDVTILATHAGLQTGEDGYTHIANEDISIMRSFPNMAIIEPSDSVATTILAKIIVNYKGPLYVRLPKSKTPVINSDNYKMTIGKANIIRNYGIDVAIIATGWILSKAIKAADILKKMGLMAQVIEIHTIKPIDADAIITAAKETGAVVTVEDHTIFGGMGSAVAEVLSENFPIPMKRIGIPDVYGESGTPEELYTKNNMTIDDIVRACNHVISMKVERNIK